jgi:hypothetical protein
MKTIISSILAAFLLVGIFSVACTPVPAMKIAVTAQPPLFSNWRVAESFVPRSQKFKIAVLTFIDQTDKARLVVDGVADMLTTELFRVGRFELYDRQDLDQETMVETAVEEKEKEKETKTTTKHLVATGLSAATRSQYQNVQGTVDGILLGYITSINFEGTSGYFQCDLRIVNAMLADEKVAKAVGLDLGISELVIYGTSGKVRFTTNADQTSVMLNRDDIEAIASKVKAEFKDFTQQTFKITGIDRYLITLGVGQNHGIKQGFTGYVITRDPKTGVYKYLAEFVVINVFPEASTAVLVAQTREAYESYSSNVHIGSEAVIK